MARVLKTPLAIDDYRVIWRRIALDNVDAADRLLRRFDQRLDLCAMMPGIGTQRDDLAPGLRSMCIGKYLLFYRVIADGIELVRALHGMRDLPPLFGHEPRQDDD